MAKTDGAANEERESETHTMEEKNARTLANPYCNHSQSSVRWPYTQVCRLFFPAECT